MGGEEKRLFASKKNFARLMCASTQRGKTKSLVCYAQRKKPTERAEANKHSTHYLLGLLGCYRVRKNPHTNSLGHLDTHPSSLSGKTSQKTATRSRYRVFGFPARFSTLRIGNVCGLPASVAHYIASNTSKQGSRQSRQG